MGAQEDITAYSRLYAELEYYVAQLDVHDVGLTSDRKRGGIDPRAFFGSGGDGFVLDTPDGPIVLRNYEEVAGELLNASNKIKELTGDYVSEQTRAADPSVDDILEVEERARGDVSRWQREGSIEGSAKAQSVIERVKSGLSSRARSVTSQLDSIAGRLGRLSNRLHSFTPALELLGPLSATVNQVQVEGELKSALEEGLLSENQASAIKSGLSLGWYYMSDALGVEATGTLFGLGMYMQQEGLSARDFSDYPALRELFGRAESLTIAGLNEQRFAQMASDVGEYYQTVAEVEGLDEEEYELLIEMLEGSGMGSEARDLRAAWAGLQEEIEDLEPVVDSIERVLGGGGRALASAEVDADRGFDPGIPGASSGAARTV